MRRALGVLIAIVLFVPVVVTAQQRGLSPKILVDAGWACFNVPGLGVHCAEPGQEFPPSGPSLQLLYFFNTTNPDSDVPDFTGTETLLRDDVFHGQPCPTSAGGEWTFLGDLGGGAEYWACHRR